MRTPRRSGLLISKIALEKLFRYLINCAGVTRQNLVSPKSRFLSHSLGSMNITKYKKIKQSIKFDREINSKLN